MPRPATADRLSVTLLRRRVTVNVAPPFGIVAGVDGAAMRVDDRPRNREADPEPVRLRRDERGEQGPVDMRRQARPGIAHREFDIGVSEPRVVIVRRRRAFGVSAIASIAFIIRFTSTCCRSTGSPLMTHGLDDRSTVVSISRVLRS